MIFTKPPLPFIGNKSKIRKDLIDILKDIKGDYVFVDLFGGSLYISHLLHIMFPKATIIANDYDNYVDRLKHIHDTNEILKELKERINVKPDEKIPTDQKEIVREVISKAPYIDWDTLCSRLLYSGAYKYYDLDTLMKKVLYLRYTNLFDENIDDYLEGLTIVHKDWRILFNEYKDLPNVFFICDPPYFHTYSIQYGDEWTLKDTVETFDVLNYPSIYFSSDKSYTEELIEILTKRYGEKFPMRKHVIDRGLINPNTQKNNEVIYVTFSVNGEEKDQEDNS